MGVFEVTSVQTSPLQPGRAQGQDQEGYEGAARKLGQKDSFQHGEEGSQSWVRKWKVFLGESN